MRLRLETHLKLLKRQNLIDDWSNQCLDVGDSIATEAAKRLDEAQIILLLLSADFLASDECDAQMTRALARAQDSSAQVVPVILTPIDWEITPLRHLQPAPTGGKPVSQWADSEAAWQDVSRSIRKLVEKLRQNPKPATAGPSAAPSGVAASASSAPTTLAPAPQPTAKLSQSRKLRTLLNKVLIMDSDLNAFCLDYFPAVKRQFTNGMDRTQKVDLLLERVDSADIVNALRDGYPTEWKKYSSLLS